MTGHSTPTPQPSVTSTPPVEDDYAKQVRLARQTRQRRGSLALRVDTGNTLGGLYGSGLSIGTVPSAVPSIT